MKTFIYFCLIVLSIQSRSEWFCNNVAIEKNGDTYMTCGVGEATNESEARLLARKNAMDEFIAICSRDSFCNEKRITLEPLRNSCESTGTSYKCYRGFQIRTITEGKGNINLLKEELEQKLKEAQQKYNEGRKAHLEAKEARAMKQKIEELEQRIKEKKYGDNGQGINWFVGEDPKKLNSVNISVGYSNETTRLKGRIIRRVSRKTNFHIGGFYQNRKYPSNRIPSSFFSPEDLSKLNSSLSTQESLAATIGGSLYYRTRGFSFYLIGEGLLGIEGYQGKDVDGGAINSGTEFFFGGSISLMISYSKISLEFGRVEYDSATLNDNGNFFLIGLNLPY